MNDYIQFNLLEGIFWIFLGLSSIILHGLVPTIYKKLAIFSAIVLIFFGISDFIEIITNGFIPGPWWLFAWKITNVIGLIGVFIWYIKLRVK